jgi:hypothetical protein
MWQGFLGFLAAVMLFMLGTTVFPQVAQNFCVSRWKAKGQAARFESYWQGCFVEVDGKWISEGTLGRKPPSD